MSSGQLYQETTGFLVRLAVSIGVAIAVVFFWIGQVFPVVGNIATGSPSWHHIIVNESPWWGFILQGVALLLAGLTTFVAAVFIGKLAEAVFCDLLGWDYAN